MNNCSFWIIIVCYVTIVLALSINAVFLRFGTYYTNINGVQTVLTDTGRPGIAPSVATFFFVLFFTCGWMLTWTLLYKLLFTSYFWITLIFAVWTFWDRKSPNQGGRLYRPLRNLGIWKLWAQYFPVNVHFATQSEFTPDENYIFGYHPHGYFGVGSLCCFATEALDISKKLSGLRITQLSTRLVYIHPIWRDLLMLLGLANASEENIQHISRKSTGNVMVLVVGGAAEALDARPGMHRLVLKDRKGFVRTSLKTGCDLVPVYGFGENDIYNQPFQNPVGSRFRNLQRWVQVLTGIPILVFVHGPYKMFFLYPFPKPINIVVGKPIHVHHVPEPSEEQIDILHEQYKNALRNLFDAHKGKYGYSGSVLEYI